LLLGSKRLKNMSVKSASALLLVIFSSSFCDPFALPFFGVTEHCEKKSKYGRGADNSGEEDHKTPPPDQERRFDAARIGLFYETCSVSMSPRGAKPFVKPPFAHGNKTRGEYILQLLPRDRPSYEQLASAGLSFLGGLVGYHWIMYSSYGYELSRMLALETKEEKIIALKKFRESFIQSKTYRWTTARYAPHIALTSFAGALVVALQTDNVLASLGINSLFLAPTPLLATHTFFKFFKPHGSHVRGYPEVYPQRALSQAWQLRRLCRFFALPYIGGALLSRHQQRY